MTDSMPTARMIVPAGATTGPLAVGDRRHREKREPRQGPARTKATAPVPEPDEDNKRQDAHGRAIDIRI